MHRPGLIALLLLVVGLAGLAAVVLGGDWETYSPDWYTTQRLTPGRHEGDQIRRAVYADGRLWVLADDEIWSLDLAPDGGPARRTGVAAYDICVHNGELTAATPDPQRPGRWRVRHLRGSDWVAAGGVASRGEGLVGLDCSGPLRLLTSKRLVTFDGGRATAVPLSRRIPAWPTSQILGRPDGLLVGLNAGEWGGALWRIDRSTGRLRRLDTTESGQPRIAEGLIAVNGLAPAPWNRACALASMGDLNDFGGHLIEICGDALRPLGVRAADDRPEAAFFGLMTRGDEAVVMTVAGLRRLGPAGRLSAVERPAFRQRGPFQISLQDGYALLRAPSDDRFHPGGANAMIVPLDPPAPNHTR